MKHRHPKLVAILATLALLSQAGSAGADNYNLPQLGRPGAAAISQSKLDDMGREMLIQLREHHLLLQDSLLTAYIRRVGHRLVAHSDAPGMDVSYYVIDTPVINAFALPGHNVFIFTGLLLTTDNENELAGVMAHETAHVTQGHIARQIADSKNNTWKALAGILAGLVLASQTGNPQIAMATVTGTQSFMMQHQINFTRHEESEADHLGIQFMAAAGYNPDGMAQLFEKLEMLSRGNLQPPTFLLNHPLNRTRITDARQRARQLPDVSHPSSQTYRLMRARARVLTAQHTNEVLAHFNGIKTTTLPAKQKIAITYGRALCLIRLNRGKQALTLLQPLLHKYDNVPAFHLAIANAQLQNRQTATALATLAKAGRIFPDNLAIKIDYARALLTAHRAPKAKDIMQQAHSRHPRNMQVLQLLAKSSSHIGNNSEGHYYLSQLYQLNGRIIPAITQIQLAISGSDISHYDMQRYKARLDHLKKLHEDRQRQSPHH